MEVILYLIIFYIGSIFGSFFLVVGLRGGKEESIISPGSYCDKCQMKLKWYHMIPIFSYVFLKGKCHYCREKIAPITILIEILTGILFLSSYLLYGFSLNTLLMILMSSLLVITIVSDFKYLVILDLPVYIVTLGILVITYFKDGLNSAILSIVSGIIVFGVILIIKLLGDKIFKKESLGGGDVKLGIVIGSLLQVKFGLMSIVISCVITIPFALIFTYLKKEKEVPFGPFLIIGTIITYIFMSPLSELIELYLKL